MLHRSLGALVNDTKKQTQDLQIPNMIAISDKDMSQHPDCGMTYHTHCSD
jgi:hypothetical protein